MSPLARLVLSVMRYTAFACAAFIAAVIGLQAYTHLNGVAWSRQDISFMVVLALILVGSLWLARSVGREIGRNQ